MKTVRIAWLGLMPAIVIIAVSCISGQQAVTDGESLVRGEIAIGRIVRTDVDNGFVVVECTYLPRAGETSTVFRDGTRVGTVILSGPFRGSMVVADIVDGDPHPGDVVAVKRPVNPARKQKL